MNKYWKYVIFPTFLDSIRDCTYVNMDDIDLTEVLNTIVKSAIEDFLFPKYSLEYAEDTSRDPLDSEEYGFYFLDENVGEAEFKVIISFMKVHWIKAQITWDNNFKNPFFDKDIKGYSPANMLTAMYKTLETFEKAAEKERFNYNRKTKDGRITWGVINAKR